jgi:hypothetical protein
MSPRHVIGAKTRRSLEIEVNARAVEAFAPESIRERRVAPRPPLAQPWVQDRLSHIQAGP